MKPLTKHYYPQDWKPIKSNEKVKKRSWRSNGTTWIQACDTIKNKENITQASKPWQKSKKNQNNKNKMLSIFATTTMCSIDCCCCLD